MKHQFRTVINGVNRIFLERIEIRLLGFLFVVSFLAWSSPLHADLKKFKVDQAGTRNFGVWRLTNDSAIREEANYHNTQCWSYNGRYTCYTRWGGTDTVGGKSSAEIHIVDLKTGKDRLVGKGINPRWANQHNWLFFCRWTGDGKAPYETGTQIIRYDADSGEKVEIVYGMESPGSLDATDTWLYGTQRYRGQKPEHIAMRVRNLPNSKLQKLPAAPNKHPHVDVNPFYPKIMVRAKDPSDPVYGMNRGFFDLEGKNLHIATTMGERGHKSWSGDGEYLIIGNRQYCGRPWNQPFPSDLVTLAYAGSGDISPCGKSGRFICGGDLLMADTRSGDIWTVVRSHSAIIYPMEGDFSTLSDIDPKGSPDGTKIHFHSTRELENLVSAKVTKHDAKSPDIIHVESTEGFPDAGEVVARWEVIAYSRKTATTFEGLTRQKYGTRPAPDMVEKVRELLPLSAYLLTGKEKDRAKADPSMLRAAIAKDNPLLYQRQSNCYAVVGRMPDPPHLRLVEGRVQLIPGENHWETQGYRLFLDGKPLSADLLKPGAGFDVSEPGEYTASAVEWSGLESPRGIALVIKAKSSGVVLENVPDDFSATVRVWQVDDKAISEANGMKAARATMHLMHPHDGKIASEKWMKGQRVSHVDYNQDSVPIRFQEFTNEKLKKQVYRTPQGNLASEEFYGADGFKTEYIKYDIRPGRIGQVTRHWSYRKGLPVKMTKGGKTVFDQTGR
jgi:hypothetical protein